MRGLRRLMPELSSPKELLDEKFVSGFNILTYLDEIRRRLLVCVIAVLVGFALAAAFMQQIFNAWLAPLQRLADKPVQFSYIEPTEAFFIQLQIAAVVGLLLALPVIFLQLWALATPALRKVERKYSLPFVAIATTFFILGAAFSHFVVFPYAWTFLGGFSTDFMEFRPTLGPTFALYVTMMLALGAIFQLPTVVFLLARMGLASAGFLARHFKIAVLISFVVAAVLTPTPDIVTQLLLAGPMVVLYVVSIGIAWLFKKRRSEEPG